MRTTISFSDVVNGWALELMAEDGYNDNFSAFLAALVREEKRRREGGTTPELNESGPLPPTPAKPTAAPVSYKKKKTAPALNEPIEPVIAALKQKPARPKAKVKGA